ncbi:IS5/IS1182 family transposase, partial [Vibrio sp. Isolate22]|nr:IS5/IS1182 family transposase [Vibrio sp. Isolate22]
SLTQWKTDSGYHDRSISETAMSRYKGLTSGTLSLRCANSMEN